VQYVEESPIHHLNVKRLVVRQSTKKRLRNYGRQNLFVDSVAYYVYIDLLITNSSTVIRNDVVIMMMTTMKMR
jgi:hypothetical protein